MQQITAAYNVLTAKVFVSFNFVPDKDHYRVFLPEWVQCSGAGLNSLGV